MSKFFLLLQIQDENHQLRSKIAELEKRVSDLTATNEFLLDQNAHLRMGGKSAGNLILHFSCRFFYKVSPRTPCFVGTQPAGVHDAVNALHISCPPPQLCDAQDAKLLICPFLNGSQ